MPNQYTLEQIKVAELTQSVRGGRAANDPFKLSAGLRTLLDNRLIDLKAKDAVTLLKEGDRATASANVRTALDTLETRLKDGYNFLQGLPSYEISDADRLGVYTSYGWTSGLIGQFTDGRIEALANQALVATPSIAIPALPDHATSLVAFRRPAGGTAVVAGDSLTNIVSVVGTGPLTPGVTYEFWLTGHNSRGNGPESPHVTHTVIVVPPPPTPGP